MSSRAKLSLLVVEDREVMLKIFRRLLMQLGFDDIDGAVNGARALERLKEKKYDLILSDWNMDEMSGFELLKRVRADAEHAHVAFILVTAEVKPENIEAAEAAGANGYLLKPFKLEALEDIVNKVLRDDRFVSSTVV